MSKSKNTQPAAALIVMESHQIGTGVLISKLTTVARQQLAAVKQIEEEGALRAIICGLTLHRVKSAVKHGQWMPWLKKNFDGSGQRQANYYMRLAIVAVEAAQVTAPELGALPADRAAAKLARADGQARQCFDKLKSFVGGRSLNELLCEYNLKDRKKLGGARIAAINEAVEPVDPELLAQQKREELSGWLESGRQLLVKENACQYLTPEDVRAVAASIDALLDEWRKGVAQILKAS